MKSTIIGCALALTFGGAVQTQAACVDTFYLSDLTMFHMSVVNSKVPGLWDSTSINPWDEASLKKATPLGFGPAVDGAFEHSYKTLHPRIIYFNCDVDSHSVYENTVVNDSFQLNQNTGAITESVYLSQEAINVKLSKTFSSGAYAGSKVIPFSVLYIEGMSPKFGRRTPTDSIKAWTLDLIGLYFDTAKFTAQTAYPHQVNSIQGLLLGPTGEAVDTQIVKSLKFMAPYVDSAVAHKGVIDSTRLEAKSFRYTFSRTKPAAASVSARRGVVPFQVRGTGRGIEFQLDQARSVSIVSPEGKVVRTLSASSSVVWDGRDAHGVAVKPGIWFAHAAGLGSVSILMP